MTPSEALATGQDVTVHPDGTAELTGIYIPGLSEGILIVEYRTPNPGEFALLLGEGDHVQKVSLWKFPVLIVKPAPGWQFVYSINENCYRPVRLFASPKKITAHFEVRNAEEEAAVRAVQSNVGFQRFEE